MLGESTVRLEAIVNHRRQLILINRSIKVHRIDNDVWLSDQEAYEYLMQCPWESANTKI